MVSLEIIRQFADMVPRSESDHAAFFMESFPEL